MDAFPFTSYGELKGDVSSIGADALEPDATANYYRYPVSISLMKSYLEPNGKKISLKWYGDNSKLEIKRKKVDKLNFRYAS